MCLSPIPVAGPGVSVSAWLRSQPPLSAGPSLVISPTALLYITHRMIKTCLKKHGRYPDQAFQNKPYYYVKLKPYNRFIDQQNTAGSSVVEPEPPFLAGPEP